jgi:integrase
MLHDTTDSSGDAKAPKTSRDQHLSPDGRWRSFPKIPNLLQYVSTGVYFARVKVNGKTIRLSLETDVFNTARLRLPDFLKKHRAKKRIEGAPATFAEAQSLYETDLATNHVLSEVSKRYRHYCLKKLNASWLGLGAKKLDRMSERECKDWASRFSSTVDEQYFNNVLGTFRAVLRAGGLYGQEDPTKDIKRIGVVPSPLKLPTSEQFGKMIQLIETSGAGQAQQCADFVRFLAFSGCRLSEARQMTWADVDFEKGRVTVHNAKVRRGANAARTRNVPMIAQLRTLLERLAQQSHDQSDKVCAVGECEKSLARASKLVGLEQKLTHHDLRHLFATRCIESDVDIPTVSRWLGHSDGGALAMKVYGHLRDDHSLDMAQRVSFERVAA